MCELLVFTAVLLCRQWKASINDTSIFTMKIVSLLIDFSLTVKVATLIFISGRGSAISSAKEGVSGFIYNLVMN